MFLFLRRSLRGFLYWRQQPGQQQNRCVFHLVVIVFVILENCLWFSSYPGFGTGAMHILCGAVIGYGLIYVWRRTWLKLAGTFGLLGYVSFSTESIICSSPTAAGYNTSPIFCPWSSSYWAFRPEKCYFPICIQANTDFLLGCREAALFL